MFNDAIEQAYTDGVTGFRAAADMTWALDRADGPYQSTPSVEATAMIPAWLRCVRQTISDA